MATLIHGPKSAQLAERVDSVSRRTDVELQMVTDTVIDWYRTFDDINIARSLWTERVNATLLPLVIQAYDDSADNTRRELIAVDDDVEPSLTAAIIPRVVSSRADEFFDGVKRRLVAIGDALWDTMRTELLIGLQLGDSVSALKDRISNALKLTAPRARNVAATEVLAASQVGSFHQVKAAKVTALKRWITKDDDRVRKSHRDVDDVQIDMDAKFIVGGFAMDYPHDPTAPLEETINCRCTLVWEIVKKDELTQDLVVESLAADAFHRPGKHDQKTHGRRYKTPGDPSSGERETPTSKSSPDRNAPKTPKTPANKPTTSRVVKVTPPTRPVTTPVPPLPSPPQATPSRTGDPNIDRMHTAYDAGYKVIKTLPSGHSDAKVEVLELSDGSQVVRKSDPNVVGGRDTTRAEYLAGRVANAVGVDDVFTAQIGPTSIITTYVKGPTGTGAMREPLKKFGFADQPEAMDRMIREHAEMSGGKSIGILDWLTYNTDRHSLNWIISDDGVRPIDQGASSFREPRFMDNGKEEIVSPDSPFTDHWLGIKSTQTGLIRSIKPKYTKVELTEYRTRLEGLRGTFDRPQEQVLFDSMMNRLAMVEEKVKK